MANGSRLESILWIQLWTANITCYIDTSITIYMIHATYHQIIYVKLCKSWTCLKDLTWLYFSIFHRSEGSMPQLQRNKRTRSKVAMIIFEFPPATPKASQFIAVSPMDMIHLENQCKSWNHVIFAIKYLKVSQFVVPRPPTTNVFNVRDQRTFLAQVRS